MTNWVLVSLPPLAYAVVWKTQAQTRQRIAHCPVSLIGLVLEKFRNRLFFSSLCGVQKYGFLGASLARKQRIVVSVPTRRHYAGISFA